MKLIFKIEFRAQRTWLRRTLALLGVISSFILPSSTLGQEYTYDAHGRVQSVSYADGTVVTFCFDPANNRTRRVVSIASANCTPTNQAPSAADDIGFGFENQAVIVQVLLNDSDPDQDALTITSVSSATPSGTPSHNGSTVSFNAPAAGSYSFTYTITDGALTSSATVLFTALERCGGLPC